MLQRGRNEEKYPLLDEDKKKKGRTRGKTNTTRGFLDVMKTLALWIAAVSILVVAIVLGTRTFAPKPKHDCLNGLCPWEDLDTEHYVTSECLDGYPVPYQQISNGDYPAEKMNTKQLHFKEYVDNMAETYSAHHGMQRDEFLKTPFAKAMSYYALNHVFGFNCFTVNEDEILKMNKIEKLSKNIFVFDVHTHWFEDLMSQRTGQGVAFTFASRNMVNAFSSLLNVSRMVDSCQLSDTPAPGVVANSCDTRGDFLSYVKEMFLDSHTDFVVISNVPVDDDNFRFVTNPQALEGQQKITEFFHEKRSIVSYTPKPIPGDPTGAWYTEASTSIDHGFDTWKFQTIGNNDPGFIAANPYRMDDFNTFGPFYNLIKTKAAELEKPSLKVIHIHKGLNPGSTRNSTTGDIDPSSPLMELVPNPNAGQPDLFGYLGPQGSPEPAMAPRWVFSSPWDIPRAAQTHPDVNFVVYHGAYDLFFWANAHSLPAFLGNGMNETAALQAIRNRDIISYWMATVSGSRPRGYLPFITDLGEIPDRFGVDNVYADLGGIWGDFLITNPEFAALTAGYLIEKLGPHNFLWGTDSIIFGSPQWQIEGFLRLNIYDIYQKYFGTKPSTLPELEVKKLVLGINAARIYGIDPDTLKFDQFKRIKERGILECKKHGVYGGNHYHGYVHPDDHPDMNDMDPQIM